jgi:hypothetical protein
VDVVRYGGFGGGGIIRADDTGDAHKVARERDELVRIDVGEDLFQSHVNTEYRERYSCGNDRMTESRRITRNSSPAT